MTSENYEATIKGSKKIMREGMRGIVGDLCMNCWNRTMVVQKNEEKELVIPVKWQGCHCSGTMYGHS